MRAQNTTEADPFCNIILNLPCSNRRTDGKYAQLCSAAPGTTNTYQVPLNTLRTQFLQELRPGRTVCWVKRLILTRQGDRSESQQKLQLLHSWFSWIHQLCHCRQWFQLDRQKWSPEDRRRTQHIFLEKYYKQLICLFFKKKQTNPTKTQEKTWTTTLKPYPTEFHKTRLSNLTGNPCLLGLLPQACPKYSSGYAIPEDPMADP